MTIAADRYLKVILSIIAIELLWIGVNQTAPAVSAQGAVTPVVIRGIELTGGDGFLPVGIAGWYRSVPIGNRTALLQPMPLSVDPTR